MNENIIAYIIHFTGRTKSQILKDFENWNNNRKDEIPFMTETEKLFYYRNIVCAYYNVDIESLNMKCRDTEYLLPRQVIHYLAKDLKLSKSIIAKHVGNLSSCIIYNSVKSISNRLETDKHFREEFQQIKLNI